LCGTKGKPQASGGVIRRSGGGSRPGGGGGGGGGSTPGPTSRHRGGNIGGMSNIRAAAPSGG
tara:strand:+ start:261 stop:446 length:186 start_codon:yes stop_codon:yes gene_type:complete